MENKDAYYKFFELYTEDGSLFIYEKYKEKPKDIYNREMPVTREFFTGEEGIRGFNTIDFLNRKCVFETEHYNSLTAEHMDTYKKELSPHEFLMKVAPYLTNEETIKRKQEEVMNILKYKAEEINYRFIKKPAPAISKELANNESQKILIRYMK